MSKGFFKKKSPYGKEQKPKKEKPAFVSPVKMAFVTIQVPNRKKLTEEKFVQLVKDQMENRVNQFAKLGRPTSEDQIPVRIEVRPDGSKWVCELACPFLSTDGELAWTTMTGFAKMLVCVKKAGG